MQKSKIAVILSMSMIGTICISNKAFAEEYAKHEGATLEVKGKVSSVDLDKVLSNLDVKSKESVKDNLKKIDQEVKKHSKEHKELQPRLDMPKNKEFTIRFTKPISENTMNNNNIKVVDVNGKEIKTTIKSENGNSKVWKITPTTEYLENGVYALILKNGIATNSQKPLKLKQEVVMKFVVKDSNTERDSMQEILKAYRGGKQYDSLTNLVSPDDFFKEYNKDKEGFKKRAEKYLLTPLYKGMPYDPRKWYFDIDKSGEYAEIRNNFNKKYFNEKYADITDINYFTKMKTNLDFSKVNNDDIIPRASYGGKNVFIYNNPQLYDDYTFKGLADIDISKDIRFQYIWRSDVEEEVFKFLNDERKKQNLKPLVKNDDLRAMSMYATKKTKVHHVCNTPHIWNKNPIFGSFMGDTPGSSYSLFRYSMLGKIGDTGETLTGIVSAYRIPFISPTTDYSKAIEVGRPNSTMYDGTKTYVKPTELAKTLGYKNYKSVVAIADGNGFIKNGSDLAKVWSLKTDSYSFVSGNGMSEDGKFVENQKLLNPKLKNIGIAVSYSIPKTPMEGQGIMNIYIMMSE